MQIIWNILTRKILKKIGKISIVYDVAKNISDVVVCF